MSKSRLDVHEVVAVLQFDVVTNKEWNLVGDYFGLRCKSPLTNSGHYKSSGKIIHTNRLILPSSVIMGTIVLFYNRAVGCIWT